MAKYLTSFAVIMAVIAGTSAWAQNAPVTIEAAVTRIQKSSGEHAQFVLRRAEIDADSAWIVLYEMSGTAVNGVDYETLGGTATFAVNETSVSVELIPKGELKITDLNVVLTVTTVNGVLMDAPKPSASITIAQETNGLRLRIYNSYTGNGDLSDLLARAPYSTHLFQGQVWFGNDFGWGPVYRGGPIGTENFAMLWDGFVWLDADETYTFATHCDDRSLIMIDTGRDGFGDDDVVVARGSTHATWNFGLASVPESGYYPIAISFVQWGGGYFFFTRWDKGNKVGHDFWNAFAYTVDTSIATAGGLPMFERSGARPGASWFSEPASVKAETTGISIASTLGHAADHPKVSVVWGAEPGVYTSTNSVTGGFASGVPFSITMSEANPGTYAYRMFVEDNGVLSQAAVNGDPGFHVGPLAFSTLSNAWEKGEIPGAFEVRRTGASSLPLRVNCTLSGTAERGVDYVAAGFSGFVTIPAGETALVLPIAPIRNFSKLDDTEVVLTLAAGAYVTNTPSRSTSLVIHNEDLPESVEGEILWLGRVSNNASERANWLENRLPLETDTIVLDATGTGDLVWDYDGENGLPATVANWRQEVDFTGTVQFNTTYGAAFPVFTITGNAVLEGGTWTHRANSNLSVYWLKIDILGDFTLGSGASVNVQHKGFARWNGPGGLWHIGYEEFGISHAGQGSWYRVRGNPNTYGSALNPMDLGSGAKNHEGPGAIFLHVGGTALLNGTLYANAHDYEVDDGGASGGSINLRATEIHPASTGLLTANGGGSHWRGAGGGGRIAIQSGNAIPQGLRFSARGNFQWDNASSAAGTIYRVTPFENRLIVDNQNIDTYWGVQSQRTDLPAKLKRTDSPLQILGEDASSDFGRTDVSLAPGGHVTLQYDFKCASFTVAGWNSSVDLNGKKLLVQSFTDASGTFTKSADTYEHNASGRFNGVNFNNGKLVIVNPATRFILK